MKCVIDKGTFYLFTMMWNLWYQDCTQQYSPALWTFHLSTATRLINQIGWSEYKVVTYTFLKFSFTSYFFNNIIYACLFFPLHLKGQRKSFEKPQLLGSPWDRAQVCGRVLTSTYAPRQPLFKLVQILCPGLWASSSVNKIMHAIPITLSISATILFQIHLNVKKQNRQASKMNLRLNPCRCI